MLLRGTSRAGEKNIHGVLPLVDEQNLAVALGRHVCGNEDVR